MRWAKAWGPLIIAIIALVVSGYAIYQDNVHYQEVTKPHTEHTEIKDKLDRLDSEIRSVTELIYEDQEIGVVPTLSMGRAVGVRTRWEFLV